MASLRAWEGPPAMASATGLSCHNSHAMRLENQKGPGGTITTMTALTRILPEPPRWWMMMMITDERNREGED